MAKPMLRPSHRTKLEDRAVCPHCNRILPRVRVDEVWIEVPLEEPWIAAYRIVAKKGVPVVAEARLFPRKERGVAGAWSGRPSTVPAQGMPGTLLRELRLRDPQQLLPAILESMDRQAGPVLVRQILERFHLKHPREVERRRPGRKGRSDRFYALFSAAYIERVRAGSRSPVKDVAASPPVRIEGFRSTQEAAWIDTVRGILTDARARGFLTKPPPGRAGGELTIKARRVLGRIARGIGT